MKRYYYSAMVVYYDTVVANTKEEAFDKFYRRCPYDIDLDSIEEVELGEEEEEN